MTKIDKVFAQLSDLYEFNKNIKKYKIKPAPTIPATSSTTEKYSVIGQDGDKDLK